MSLFFVKDNFDEFIKKLLQRVNEKGFIVANFLGKEDDWDGKRTTMEKEKLLEYFKDFDINYFSEEKYYKETAFGKNKFWHVYSIIAQAKLQVRLQFVLVSNLEGDLLREKKRNYYNSNNMLCNSIKCYYFFNCKI